MLVGDMGVYLRRCNIGMAEERLHRAEVSTVTEKVSCKAVAKFVGSDFARNA